MHIGIDGINLRERNAGSLRYFEQLLSALDQSEASGNWRYEVFTPRSVYRTVCPSRGEIFNLVPTTPRRFIPAALQQQFYRGWNSQGNLDLLHSTVFVPPLGYPGKTVMTVFDLTFHLYPQTQKWTGRWWWRLCARPGFRKADTIISISENTRQELHRYFGVPLEKIHRVYPSVQERFRPTPAAAQTARRYGLPEKYLLYVGTFEPRKNIPGMLRAFDQARRAGSLEHKLVLIGRRGWMVESIFRLVDQLGLQKQVIFLENVGDADLPALYSAADLFLFLSLYEGFGIPLLEAMACGTPVVAAQTASLPEVVGDAGILVPPTETELAAQAILRILQDRDLHQQLSQQGIARAAQFSLERLRTGTLAVYQKGLEG